MGNRYSDIKRGARLQEGLNNYIQYLQSLGTRPSRIGQQGPRNLDKLVFIKPFLIDVEATEVLSAQNTTDGYNQLQTYINGDPQAAVTDNIGTDTLAALPNFRAARVILFLNATRSVTVARSDVTNLEYLKYAGTRYSCAFGATADTDDIMDAFAGIKAATIQALGGTNEICQVSLSRERVSLG
ncbi:MAG: hypothetical protein AAF609_12610 [Cyanobacteria bacterium P01_C01_bin.120]